MKEEGQLALSRPDKGGGRTRETCQLLPRQSVSLSASQLGSCLMLISFFGLIAELSARRKLSKRGGPKPK